MGGAAFLSTLLNGDVFPSFVGVVLVAPLGCCLPPSPLLGGAAFSSPLVGFPFLFVLVYFVFLQNVQPLLKREESSTTPRRRRRRQHHTKEVRRRQPHPRGANGTTPTEEEGAAAPTKRREEKASAPKRGNPYHTDEGGGESSTTQKEGGEGSPTQDGQLAPPPKMDHHFTLSRSLLLCFQLFYSWAPVPLTFPEVK